MLPAHQRLGPDRRCPAGLELGLVMQHQLAAADRLAQFLQQFQLAVRAHVERLGEEGIAVPARILGVVHRRIGVGHQVAFGGGVGRVQRDAQAGTDLQFQGIDLERLGHAGDDPFGDHGRIFRILHLEHDDELIAPQSREGVLCTQQRGDPLADLDQQLVTKLVTVGIVDRLEAVQVAEHHREAELPALRLLDRLLDAVLQQHPVGQLGQRIMQGGLHQLLVGLGQRIGEQAGAGAHLAVEHRRDQCDPQRRQRRDDHQHRQPLGLDALAIRRATHRALGEVGRGHAGVVHADDRQAHHQRGQPAQHERAALFQAQAEGDPQRRTGRADGDQDRGGKPQGVVVDARLHLQRGHAQVMHGRDPQAHQHRAGAQPRPRQLRA